MKPRKTVLPLSLRIPPFCAPTFRLRSQQRIDRAEHVVCEFSSSAFRIAHSRMRCPLLGLMPVGYGAAMISCPSARGCLAAANILVRKATDAVLVDLHG